MEQIQRMLGSMRGGGGPAADTPLPDTSEKIQISSLSLLKMLKHGRAGIPMEVMGLMLGMDSSIFPLFFIHLLIIIIFYLHRFIC